MRRHESEKKMKKALVLALMAAALPATTVAQDRDYDFEKKVLDVEKAIAEVKESDPGLKRFFEGSYAYAVLPNVGKGGFVVGGARGGGLVYEQGKLAGEVTMTQVTVGLQLGGQSYIEVIFFKDKQDLARLKANALEFSAQVSAVAITAGASADVDYSKGVAVFTKTKGGLMYEASLGGQTFEFKPLK
jgi:lipid-binding SYLF domain-containing protein